VRVQDLLRKKGDRVVQVRPGTPLSQAMNLMAAEGVGTVLLIDDAETLRGIISERDFVRIFTEHGAKALDFPVCDLVRRDVIVCHDDVSLHDLITLMSNNGIRHLPVMREGRVAGMVSARDVLDAQKGVLMRLVKRQKQALRLAMKAKDRAEASDHHKTEFLHRISHELRTPLNAIIGFSSMIEAEFLGPLGAPQYKDYSAEIGGAGNKLLTVIDEILEMSRLELGAYASSDEIVDMAHEVRVCVARFRDMAARKSLSLTAVSTPEPVLLVADRKMVRKMLGHLISNGVKFTPTGGAVQVGVDVKPSGAILVDVSDTGPGIPAGQLDWITKPFGCVEEAMTQSSEGAGLGLALTTAMIALHQGTLDIAGRPGGGTTVTLNFPAERAHVETADRKRIA
jgi:signal transduction histidine kinase